MGREIAFDIKCKKEFDIVDAINFVVDINKLNYYLN